ncbi:unnamed protein product [Paramecium pentaurelia]|uniref:Uncharacterized protein n=1 Tax=Paramecium pentaurelia TaxID=43138 RepID=A0A8S1TNZ9_9CILI|nr:unnamed protein product [Paramecium pentaurelia]
MQTLKEYVPIVLIKDQISKRDSNLEANEEKIHFKEQETKSPKISFHINSSRSTSIQNTIPNFLKATVFPNILSRTKLDIIRYRHSQQIQLDPDNLTTHRECKLQQEIKTRQKEKDKSNSKMHTQFTKGPSQKPIITQLTTLIKDNFSISERTSSFKFRSLSPEIEGQVWQKNNKVNRINKAYEIQKKIHHLERFKTYWKTDEIQQILQQKIVQIGVNTKKGLKQIFILIFLPHQCVNLKSSQIEAKQITNNLELSIFPFFIPIYEKIINDKELIDNFRQWISYFLDILHFRNQMKYTKVFTLDSIEITQLNQLPQYDKFLYIQLQGQFDLWIQLKQQLNLSGEFQLDKYPKLAIKLLDLKCKEDISRFFKKRENLLPFYFRQQQHESQTTIPSQYLIEVENDLREPDEQMFEQSIIQMNEQEQDTYLKLLQQYIQSNKSKYSNKLKNLEEMMRQRLEKIKAMKRYSIQIKLQAKKYLGFKEEEIFEQKLMQENEQTIQEIQEEAFDEIMPQNTHIFKKKQKQNLSIEDPFQSFQNKDNEKFKEIIQLINIEKIILEKNLSRQDIYYYLSLFKALMDSDTTKRIKDVKYPTLFISVDQLKRGIAFIALYKNTVNTKKLAEVYNRKYQYCEFMEFLDIFTTEYRVTDEELKDIELNKEDSIQNYRKQSVFGRQESLRQQIDQN